MNLPSYRHFSPPPSLSDEQQVKFCVSVINRYQAELPQLRATTTRLKSKLDKTEAEVVEWQQKYQEEKQKNDRLHKEIEQLKEQVEKLTITTNRYQASLFDHGNFKSQGEQEKKPKGGKQGHADTNREAFEAPLQYEKKRIFLTNCPTCGEQLSRVNATRQKTLLDIVLNPQIVQLIIESERQWCGSCHEAVSATDDQSLPFTEYGINTFMMVLLLRFRCLLPLSKIATVLSIGYGLNISQSGISSLLRQAKVYLGFKYEELQQIVRMGHIMYTDETGWQVRDKQAWMWIMANEEATVYVAAESMGKGIAQEMYGNSQSFAMHDGYGGYTSAIPPDKHMYCWAHLLRFCFEETVGKRQTAKSVTIRDKLVIIHHLSKDPQYHDHPQNLEKVVAKHLDNLLKQKTKDSTSLRLLRRVRQQRDGLIRALIVSPNGTNNFAEQELRPIALARKISYGSDTYTGMETNAVLASIVQTYVRTKKETFFPELATTLRTGFVNS